MCEETIAKKPKDNFFETTMTKTSEDFVWKIGNFSEIQETAKKDLLPGTGNHLVKKFTDEKDFNWVINFYLSINKGTCPIFSVTHWIAPEYQNGNQCSVRFSMCAMTSSGKEIHGSTKYKTYRCHKSKNVLNKNFFIDYKDELNYFVQSDGFLNLKFTIEYTNIRELSGFKSETRTE
eukprot:GHVP01002583.1.p1 GENE.GHVP01002583.1~~GHVP01002583.1.p1  ORF type:complete len:177 (-),score=21.82 GHVP01002583.1:50-580(-)